MGDDMLMNMLSAQATWDATMGFNGVEALKAQNDPKAIMVILVGSGHVAYGVGIERQARKWFDGPIATLIPVSVGTPARGLVKSTQASYANFIWGIARRVRLGLPVDGHVDGRRDRRHRAPGDHRAGRARPRRRPASRSAT